MNYPACMQVICIVRAFEISKSRLSIIALWKYYCTNETTGNPINRRSCLEVLDERRWAHNSAPVGNEDVVQLQHMYSHTKA